MVIHYGKGSDNIVSTLPLSQKSKLKYLELLPGKIWKTLPLYEQSQDYKVYLKRLLDDLNSANDLFDEIFTDIIVKLNVVLIEDLEHKEIRARVLECTSAVDKIMI